MSRISAADSRGTFEDGRSAGGVNAHAEDGLLIRLRVPVINRIGALLGSEIVDGSHHNINGQVNEQESCFDSIGHEQYLAFEAALY